MTPKEVLAQAKQDNLKMKREIEKHTSGTSVLESE
jgi:hypothetical protein